MAEDQAKPSGPDITQGISLNEVPDGGMLVGHVGDDEVLLVRRGTNVFAVGASEDNRGPAFTSFIPLRLATSSTSSRKKPTRVATGRPLSR